MNRDKKIIVLGYGRHGKDSVCEIIANYLGVKYEATSQVCATAFIFDELKEKYNYTTPEECFHDRSNHRAEWHELIKDYNSEDSTSVATLVYETNQIYCGVRDTSELNAMIKKFDPIVIWVTAIGRIKPEGKDSMNVEYNSTFFTIDNSGTEDLLRPNVEKLLLNLGFNSKWVYRFMNLANHVATWSKDPNGQVGAVLVSPDKHSVIHGYNGLPNTMNDILLDTISKEEKLNIIVHAERNCIENAMINNIDLTGWSMYINKSPCMICSDLIINAGISHIIIPALSETSSWYENQTKALKILNNNFISVTELE